MSCFRKIVVALFAGFLAASGGAHGQTWEVDQQQGGYKIARVVSSGAIGGAGLTCERGVAVLALKLARPAARNPAAATLTVNDAPVRIAVMRNGQTDVWVAVLRDTALLDAIARGGDDAAMSVSVDGGQTGTIPLAGARSAMGGALAGCYRMPETVAKAAPHGAPGATTLTPGLYVLTGEDEVDCRDLTWDALFWYGVEANPTYLVSAGEPVEGDVLGPTRFSLDQYTIYERCPTDQLDADVRYYDAKDRKSLKDLPIKPGMYVLVDPTTGKKMDVGGGYYLFEPTRYAVSEADWMDGKITGWRNSIVRIKSVEQMGARVYRIVSDSDGFLFPLLIEAPDRFMGWFAENDTLRFVPIDPSKVPAAARPHF